ncbi:proline racemase family protein, partial [Clostridioides difficile]
PEKKEYLEENLDYLRTAIMLEPRGHNDMFGSVMTQPCCPDADLLEQINPNSLEILQGFVEPTQIKDAKPFDKFQFVRNGFFSID